eukprot:snap_masked-scaffold_30-processed-gene-0.29-mRNA-1 protein AED:0.34 eAED:0.34 QI:0/0/0/0.5/1/1/2/0/191
MNINSPGPTITFPFFQDEGRHQDEDFTLYTNGQEEFETSGSSLVVNNAARRIFEDLHSTRNIAEIPFPSSIPKQNAVKEDILVQTTTKKHKSNILNYFAGSTRTYSKISVPTTKPSFNPTESPSVQPSESPSTQPTNLPSTNPTESPTNFPTDQPSPFPTVTATLSPTPFPTLRPPSLCDGCFEPREGKKY